MLDFFKHNNIQNIPKLIAINEKLHCFLMTSCGDVSLRKELKGEINLPLFKKGIDSLSKIMIKLNTKNESLLSEGVPDWSLRRFPALYLDLINRHELLHSDGLLSEEAEQLNKLYPNVVKLCRELSNLGVTETLTHCDFHDDNIIIDKQTKETSIIDWGETAISHPFFSLCSFLWNITYHYNVSVDDYSYQKLKDHCLEPWRNLFSDKILLECFELATKLHGIYAALTYQRMYDATKDKDWTVQQQHPGSIAGCLRTFIIANP